MVAYDFKVRFEDKILLGEKRSTIRLPRKNGHAKIGDTLQLYTGRRTPACRLIMVAPCQERRFLRFQDQAFIDAETEKLVDLVKLAMVEGFDSPDDLLQWFQSDERYQDVILHQIFWLPIL